MMSLHIEKTSENQLKNYYSNIFTNLSFLKVIVKLSTCTWPGTWEVLGKWQRIPSLIYKSLELSSTPELTN